MPQNSVLYQQASRTVVSSQFYGLSGKVRIEDPAHVAGISNRYLRGCLALSKKRESCGRSLCNASCQASIAG
jgi:hypothetical protein